MWPPAGVDRAGLLVVVVVVVVVIVVMSWSVGGSGSGGCCGVDGSGGDGLRVDG